MPTKRKTKQQKEAEEKAALRQPIADVYAGATGWLIEAEDSISLESASRAITALRQLFNRGEDYEFMWQSQNLEHFETIDQATDFLYRYGVKAR